MCNNFTQWYSNMQPFSVKVKTENWVHTGCNLTLSQKIRPTSTDYKAKTGSEAQCKMKWHNRSTTMVWSQLCSSNVNNLCARFQDVLRVTMLTIVTVWIAIIDIVVHGGSIFCFITFGCLCFWIKILTSISPCNYCTEYCAYCECTYMKDK